MKYGIIKVKRAFLYEENGVDVVDEVFFGWSVMWEDEGEWIEDALWVSGVDGEEFD